MTPEERDRLVRLEENMKSISVGIEELRGDVKAMKLQWARAGGIMIALTAFGAFIGWLLSQAKAVKGLFD